MSKNTPAPEDKICIAQIGAAHGIRGEVRIKLFSDDPASLTQYGPLQTADGSQRFKITSARASKTIYVCRIKGVSDRNDVEALNGTLLYVDRDQLPELEEEEFYHSDLIGLEARLDTGDALGSIVAVHDFGAGELLDIAPKRGKGFYVPFTREAVPIIDLTGGFVTVVPPEGLLEDADEGERALEGEAVDFAQSPQLLDGLEKG
ncbi:ribosome maturation factor RimM [Cohaesibacter celericrescens]|uniref:ribosome maturation factor RimM n=1 Tax=Cohaesibacter celericrescens TaxID=2067669 RepID=UPI0035613C83